MDQRNETSRLRLPRLTLFYRMLKFGATYVEQGQAYYEQKYKDRLLRNLSKRVKEFGFQLTPFRISYQFSFLGDRHANEKAASRVGHLDGFCRHLLNRERDCCLHR